MGTTFCIAPNGDFKAIRIGKASVVTDHIDRFSQRNCLKIRTKLSDIIITATGLDLIAFWRCEIPN
jgi:cation diffusion facilitator CzcD-associated flavoprotein CzcO